MAADFYDSILLGCDYVDFELHAEISGTNATKSGALQLGQYCMKY